jgi:hypothetical protein
VRWSFDLPRPAGNDGSYRVSRNREVGFDAIIELTVGDHDEVWLGGRAVLVVAGMLDWPGA